jgi:hypothetical protein
MADDVTPVEAERPLVPDRRERARRSSYRFRFGLIYVLLAAVLGAAVGSFIVLASRGATPEEPAWSAWHPTGSRLAKVRQIADRIPKVYKNDDGSQLTISLASSLAVPTEQGDVPVRAVVVRPDTSKGLAEEDDIKTYDGREVITYGLCGADSKQQCEISLHAQVRRRRRLGDRLHAALAEGAEQRHRLPPARRRGRRARASDQLSAADETPSDRAAPVARGGSDHPAHAAPYVCGAGSGDAGREPGSRPDAAEPAVLT